MERQVALISTPNSLVNYSAEASAKRIVDYCLPVLHDYFMAKESDAFYRCFMVKKRIELGIKSYKPMFSVSRNTKSLVKYIKILKDSYWSTRILGHKKYRHTRSLVSRQIIRLLNEESDRGVVTPLYSFGMVTPLCRLVIQLLFCYDVGDLPAQIVTIPKSACSAFGSLLQDLGPFHMEFLDVRSIYFASVSPFKILLTNAPDLKKIYVKESCIGHGGMDLLPRLCSKTLTEIGIERDGFVSESYDLFRLFFKGKSDKEVTRAASYHPSADMEITFLNLLKVCIYCTARAECFHRLRLAVSKFYTRLELNAIDESHYQMLHDIPCGDGLNARIISVATRDFPALAYNNPVLRVKPVKFVNTDEYRDITFLELVGSSGWFEEHDLENCLANNFSHITGLKLFICEDIRYSYDPQLPMFSFNRRQMLWLNYDYGLHPREREGFSRLFMNIGRKLLTLKINVSLAADLTEALHCLNLCPILREFSLHVSIVCLNDNEPVLQVSLNPLPELTKIEFRGGVGSDLVGVTKVFEKIIKAAPKVQYLKFSDSMIKKLHLMNSECLAGVVTLHLRNLRMSEVCTDTLMGFLQACPAVRELVLENVHERSPWLNHIAKTTALSVRYVIPKCLFLEEIRMGD
ncbi:uncharacterized protein [Macrobrachium rosenbergii]|uniref:uncharacterized protein n=1 Tax=Macrobrachium rosenbergii TaxID=79674 RepID=UPI0034D55BB4